MNQIKKMLIGIFIIVAVILTHIFLRDGLLPTDFIVIIGVMFVLVGYYSKGEDEIFVGNKEQELGKREDNILEEYGEVHDYEITCCTVDFENCILEISTKNYNGERKIIKFEGLLAHSFENVIRNSIIFSVSQITTDCFISDEQTMLEESFKYGFPTPEATDSIELKKYFQENEYQVFYIISSVGMCGYIIAKAITIDSLMK